MRFLFVFLLFFFALAANGQDDTEFKTFYEPEGEIFVGQTVRLWVEISTSGKITTPPQYPELKIEGAISLLPELGAVSFSDGDRIGLKQRYVIIPQRAGAVTVPPLQIIFGAEIDDKTSEQTLSVAPEPFQAILPPGTEGFERIVTTSDLKVTETYDREFVELKTGDAITRTITTVAGGTFALALPDISFQTITGAKQYPATPQLSDSSNRGQYRATRVDAATYVFEKAGDTTLPEITVHWFDPKSNSVKNVILPAVDLTIAVNPDYAESSITTATEDSKTRLLHQIGRALVWLQDNIVKLTILAIIAYLIRLIWVRYYPVVSGTWHAHQQKILQSEKYAFKRFKKACGTGDMTKAKTEFWHWLDHFSSPNQTASLSAIFERNPGLDSTNLSEILSANSNSNSDPAALRSEATSLRENLLAAPTGTEQSKTFSLNPRHP